jgi:large subunit ribosomal protein L24
MPIDPQTGKPTRVKYTVVDGKKTRTAKSGAALTVQE